MLRSLAADAALVVGLDLSEAQLAAARAAAAGTRWHPVQGAAEHVPFAEAVFDLVFCDHGALSWAPPHLAVPEAARVLRPGGRLVFNTASPWLHVCYDEAADRVEDRLRQPYFGLHSIAEEEGDSGATSYVLGYGDWIRLLYGSGLVVEDLAEPRPGPGDRSGYWTFDPPGWPSRWPCEALWVARRPG
jgi:SAM-dependent methyltransferase